MKIAQIYPDGYYKNGPHKLYLLWAHSTPQCTLELDDSLAWTNFLMCENKAKNTVKVGEFNQFLQEQGTVEQFVHILGVEIEEEKYSCILQLTGK